MERDRGIDPKSAHIIPTRDERRIARDAYMHDVGVQIIRTQLSELVHEARDILKHKGDHPASVVDSHQRALDTVYIEAKKEWSLSPFQVDDLAEVEYQRRQDELKQRREDKGAI